MWHPVVPVDTRDFWRFFYRHLSWVLCGDALATRYSSPQMHCEFFAAGRRPAPWTFTRSRPAVFSDVRHGRHRRVRHWQRPPCAASPKDYWSGTRTAPLSPRTSARQCARASAQLTMVRSTENCSLGHRERGQGRGSSERDTGVQESDENNRSNLSASGSDRLPTAMKM